MKLSKITNLSLLILLFALIGCTTIDTQVPLVPIVTTTKQIIPTSVTTPVIPNSKLLINTATPQPNTPAPILLTPTPPHMPPSQPITCNKSSLRQFSNQEGISGALGLVVRLTPEEMVPYTSLFGGVPLQEYIFQSARHNLREIGFSPNQAWFAYQAWSDDSKSQSPEPIIYMISDDGEFVSTHIPFSKNETNGSWFGSWISEDLILIVYGLPSEINGTALQTYTIFNPFTGERLDHVLDSLPGWDSGTVPYFSPDMTRVVYMQRGNEANVMVLWDLQQEKELWNHLFISDVHFYEIGMGSANGFGKTVIWSPDSSNFAFSSWDTDKYFSSMLDRNGKKLDVIIQALSTGEGAIYEGAWSPDNRYIVYLNEYYDSTSQKWLKDIMLYDSELRKAVQFCRGLEWASDILWSPKSDYLAFTTKFADHLELVIAAIYTGEIIRLGQVQNFFALGWLENEAWLNKD